MSLEALIGAGALLAARRARRAPSPAALARWLDPRFNITATIALLSDIAVRWVREPDQRDIVSTPPRTGKSQTLAVWTTVWALADDPELEVAIISNGDDLAKEHSSKAREIIKEHSARLGYRLSADKTALGRWRVEGHAGGMLAAGINSHIVGFGADLMILDDVVGGATEADSATHRQKILNEYQGSLATRIHPGGSCMIVMCMTGDTPVLMANGTEMPLRDVRPGGWVATYENGALAISTIRNWANQGPDSIYSIKMKSGRVVRANARHPFLTIEDGREVWQRTDGLKKGSVILTAIGGSGGGRSARSMDAMSKRSARDCAHLTTTKSAGQTGTGQHQKTSGNAGCATDMESSPRNTPPSSNSRKDSAPSVGNRRQAGTSARTGTGSSASTTITSPAVSEGCSATTATLPSDTASHPRSCAPPLSTYRIEPDEVIDVSPCGVEDVFDLQIDRTENFIANGLVSHNTRWHEEDLAGAMLKLEPDRWNHTNVPAISEAKVPDALGRPPGVTMTSALGFTKAHYAAFRRTVGQRMWYAQFMGVPSTPEGTLVKQAWFDDWRLPCAPANPVMTVVSIDPADSGKGDKCGLVATSRTRDFIALIADKSAQMTSDEWATAAVDLAIDVGASQIAVEGYSARETYTRMVREAIEKARAGGRLRHAIKVSAWPEKGRPRPGDAIARSGPLLQALETGAARLAGRFPELEAAAVIWQRGQHQPDELAAWVVGHDVLVNSIGQAWDIAVPGADEPSQQVPGSVTDLDDWMSRRVG